ncbi:hypothetical protein [Helicobacter zhangjianzhongii]|uniref:Uncharacterized protein n=1 Tax=Helicobacter zhangjianzhongii TaxID=2974574 RepID=A0ACC6FRG8_9HELI|nr:MULTISPECIES: hypothetical protein [unclassified Helicobacter]MDL0079599.1 hypothetical protein [Helicobacter sp. CPD2-1]MDL0081502.1 hypothetical protein [Helicobacter sp. XJK30-2]
MALSYKLVMFGFPALCEDIDEVQARMRQIPPERAKVETLEQCYVIDLHTGVRYEIACDEKGFYICDFSADTSE